MPMNLMPIKALGTAGSQISRMQDGFLFLKKGRFMDGKSGASSAEHLAR